MSEPLISYLSQFMTEARFARINEVAATRTRYITVALEDIYQPQNASAVLRTCDCLGVQDIHVIEKDNPFTVNPDVELGSAKWLDIHRYSDGSHPAQTAIRHLRSKGYRIVATTPHRNDLILDDCDLATGPVALFFGTEMRGLTAEVIEQADEFIRIPMYGFTESFNLSVSAAICLYTLCRKLRASQLNWHLSARETEELILAWMRKSIQSADLLEKRFNFNQK